MDLPFHSRQGLPGTARVRNVPAVEWDGHCLEKTGDAVIVVRQFLEKAGIDASVEPTLL